MSVADTSCSVREDSDSAGRYSASPPLATAAACRSRLCAWASERLSRSAWLTRSSSTGSFSPVHHSAGSAAGAPACSTGRSRQAAGTASGSDGRSTVAQPASPLSARAIVISVADRCSSKVCVVRISSGGLLDRGNLEPPCGLCGGFVETTQACHTGWTGRYTARHSCAPDAAFIHRRRQPRSVCRCPPPTMRPRPLSSS
ncbi:hypothetical protein METUNv1_02860 [Methyloversatilis universalis FAM5]|uniref:Uncharacterized protein n=1 Tax=Methyloversatilis universalis (strain ATCC BAA-1314 / DSM 25237 / JCM 13912 / CCUG 52030 / FAM5) TaxID=1000565 RepID=F5REY5_METUF|nr:hypothetical protein METUNv1_02860 [Methyloversatilis universalis FAM5]